ncbi:hypothetical protein A2U01_0119009, partial [Trifolium medium]|nr:hypothetical protein [Trifolium medium]
MNSAAWGALDFCAGRNRQQPKPPKNPVNCTGRSPYCAGRSSSAGFG